MTLCSNCGERKTHAHGLCSRCNSYQERTGSPRPSDIERMSTDALLEAVARFVNGGESLRTIAASMGVSHSTLSRALTGGAKCYRYILDLIPADYVKALLRYRRSYGSRKLTPAQARKMRIRYSDGAGVMVLARWYRVDRKTVYNVVTGRLYRECGGPVYAAIAAD